MAFLVKALFRWNEYSKSADISVLSNFLAIFFEFFLHIEKFCQVLFTCQISDQLDHSNRNYRGGGAESAKSPACLGLIVFCRMMQVPVYSLFRRLLKQNSAKTHGTDYTDIFSDILFRPVHGTLGFITIYQSINVKCFEIPQCFTCMMIL